MNPLLLMVELEYERVARICDNMFSYKKSTVLLLSGIPKAEFLLIAAVTEKSHMLKNTRLAIHGT